MFASVPRMRITTWCAVWGYVLLASGLPLPFGNRQSVGGAAARDVAGKRLAAKDRSRPFPCMDKPCGCATAEQCFTSCCCHTPAETLAWARARGMDPAVLDALARRAGVIDDATAQGGCCSAASDSAPSCCVAANAEPACCTAQAAAADAPQPASEPAVASMRTVTLRALLACGGIVAQWSAVAAAPPPARLHPPLLLDRSVEPLVIWDESLLTQRPAPESPPPRAA
jgi:hypothetical protein